MTYHVGSLLNLFEYIGIFCVCACIHVYLKAKYFSCIIFYVQYKCTFGPICPTNPDIMASES